MEGVTSSILVPPTNSISGNGAHLTVRAVFLGALLGWFAPTANPRSPASRAGARGHAAQSAAALRQLAGGRLTRCRLTAMAVDICAPDICAPKVKWPASGRGFNT
jgi:hypothetical protein